MAVTSTVSIDDWALVDGNPAPGEPAGIHGKEATFRSISENADRCRRDLISLRSGNSVLWEGDAADAFQQQLDKSASVPDDLLKLSDSYLMAANALGDYARKLEELQNSAVDAVRRAAQAHKDDVAATDLTGRWSERCADLVKERDANREYVNKLKRAMSDPAYSDRTNPANAQWAATIDGSYRTAQSNEATYVDSLKTATESRDKAKGSLDDARNRLNAAKDSIRQIRTDREGIVNQTVTSIQDASKVGIQNKSWWQKAADYVKDHWVDILDNISKVLGWVGLILGVVAAIVAIVATGGAALPVILAIGLAVAALKLGVDTVLYSQGRRSLGDLAGDVIDVVTSAVGLKGAVAAHALASGTGAAVSAAKSAGPGVFKSLLESGAGSMVTRVAKRGKQFADLVPKQIIRTVFKNTTVSKVAGWTDSMIVRYGSKFSPLFDKPGKKFLLRFAEKYGVPKIRGALIHMGVGVVTGLVKPPAQRRYDQCYDPTMATVGSGGGEGW